MRRQLIVFACLLLPVLSLIAQNTPPPPVPGGPGLQLPIDDYIPALLCTGVLVGAFFVFKMKKSAKA